MNTVATNNTTNNPNKFATVHTRLRALGVTHEIEKRNIYAAVVGVRSLREMTPGQRRNLEAWLYKQINAAPKPAPYVSDEEAQSWLD